MNPRIYVKRRSYDQDLIFELLSIDASGIAQLRGCMHRIIADAPLSDLIRSEPRNLNTASLIQEWKENFEKRTADHADSIRYPVKVLHVDSDPRYLNLCLSCYQIMDIPAAGVVMEERRQPLEILSLLHKHHPDILILTGHDALPKGKDPNQLLNYKSSCYFAEAIKKSREYEPHPDRLVIYAGACQSYYEKLLHIGANFASSPGRILIHALDPVIVCETIAFTAIDTLITSQNLAEYTYSGAKGIGGYQTYGKLRLA